MQIVDVLFRHYGSWSFEYLAHHVRHYHMEDKLVADMVRKLQAYALRIWLGAVFMIVATLGYLNYLATGGVRGCTPLYFVGASIAMIIWAVLESQKVVLLSRPCDLTYLANRRTRMSIFLRSMHWIPILDIEEKWIGDRVLAVAGRLDEIQDRRDALAMARREAIWKRSAAR